MKFCCKCHQPISLEREEALKILGRLFYEYDCVECHNKQDIRIKGIYTGISGASPLILTDKLGEESHLSFEDDETQKEFKIDNKDIIEEYYSDNN